MSAQEDGEENEGQSNQDLPSQSEPRNIDHLGTSGVRGRSADHQQSGQGNLSKTETELADRIKRSDLWMISLTAAIVVLTGMNVWVFYRESEGSARDIKELTTKAGDMVTAVSQSLVEDRTTIKAILKENHEALAASEGQIDSSLRESANQGRAGLQAATAQMRLDQRAWIGFVADNVAVVNGNKLTQAIVVTNSGKTPAFNVKMKSEGKFIPHGTEVTPPDYKGPVWIGEGDSASTMPPGNARQIFVPPVTFTDDGVKQINAGTVVYYQFGYVTYEDVFRRHHRTNFCVYMIPGLSGTTDCRKFNDAD